MPKKRQKEAHIMRNPGFGVWNRNDDPADGANPDWLTSQNIWGGPEGGEPVDPTPYSEVENAVLRGVVESAEIAELRKICEQLKRQGKLSFDNIIAAVITRQRNRQRRGRDCEMANMLTTKKVRQMCNEYM